MPVPGNYGNLLTYKSAGFTHYTMTEDLYPLTNADGELGTADDGVINADYMNVLNWCADERVGLKAMIRNFRNDPQYFINDDDSVRYMDPPNNKISYNIPVRTITNELTEYAAVDGYYMADEPSWTKIGTLGPLVDWYNRYGGNTLFHVNLNPSYGTDMLEGHTYQEYVDYFCDSILSKVNGPKTLSTDYYPLMKKTTFWFSEEKYIDSNFLSDYFILAHKVKELNASVKNESDKVQLNLYIDANSLNNGKNRDVTTKADIRFMTNCAVAFGAKSLNYYGYTGSDGKGLVNVVEGVYTPTKLYKDVQETNAELQSLADAVLNFDWVGTRVYRGEESGDQYNEEAFAKIKGKVLSRFRYITDVNCTYDTIISEMKDSENNKGYMVVNYSEPSQNLTDSVSLTFEDQIQKAIIYHNGEKKVENVENNALTLNLAAGEGAFVYPVYAAQ